MGALNIRQATEQDIPPMVNMGLHFLKGSPYAAHLEENPEQMADLGRKLLVGDNGMLVAERHGVMVGMLGYCIYTHLISGEKTAGEVFWWVEPEHRGDGLRLLARFEAIARAAGAKKLQMIAPNEQVATVYERLGFGFMESAYQKAL